MEAKMNNKLDEGYCLFGTKALLDRLQNVAKEIHGVREADDIEAIHDMRVATRRVRSALALFKECFGKYSKKWNKKMRRVTKALGAARDIDVQMDFLQGFLDGLTEPQYDAGIKRLMLRLRQRREELQEDVIKAMDKLEASGVLEKMGAKLRQARIEAKIHHVDENSPCVYEQAYVEISMRMENVLAYEEYVDQPERKEEHHAMRIAAKRLRYTMEIFNPLYNGGLDDKIKAMRNIQTVLGDMHDCDVWIEYLPQFLDEEKQRTEEYFGHTKSFSRLVKGIDYLMKERQEQRERLYQEFVSIWWELRNQNFFEDLVEQISSSFALQTSVFSSQLADH
jgi:CHAD domain-containing protein